MTWRRKLDWRQGLNRYMYVLHYIMYRVGYLHLKYLFCFFLQLLRHTSHSHIKEGLLPLFFLQNIHSFNMLLACLPTFADISMFALDSLFDRSRFLD